MSTSFEKYSDVLFDAFRNNSRKVDIATKKKEILNCLLDYHGLVNPDILFVGFNPSILECSDSVIYLTEVSQEVRDFLIDSNVVFTYIDYEQLGEKKFSVIVALDEYFTFAGTDKEQKNKVDNFCSICDKFIITTLKDYKNQDFKDKEFSTPLIVRDNQDKRIYFEHYEYDINDRNASLGTNYVITHDEVTIVGPFARRNMFFKQLAKFSFDAGAQNFLVHKNLMHKSIIKKNYEHIITIKF